MRKDLMITGFGAFPGMRINPSARLVAALLRDRRWGLHGLRVEGKVLRVGYGIVAQSLQKLAKNPPRALLMFGVAGRARQVRIELRAVKQVSRQATDSTRALPTDGRLERTADVTRAIRARALPLRLAMRKAGVRARLSRSAGRYVCNAAYWHALGAMPASTAIVFVHIPMLRPSGTRKSDKRPGHSPPFMDRDPERQTPLDCAWRVRTGGFQGPHGPKRARPRRACHASNRPPSSQHPTGDGR